MYRIGICDDDKILCSLLEEQLQELSADISVTFEIEVWYSGESLERDLRRGVGLDILFLDIELVQKNGIETGAFIRDEMGDTDTHIVYISSKQGYAMELFKIQPLEFLIKPVSAVRLREVLERSMRRNRCAESSFAFQRGSQIFRIPIREIIYFMSMDKKVFIIKKDGQEEFYGKLKHVMEQLPTGFLMIHQSYVIHQEYVSEYSYESIKMMNGDVLSVSKPYRKEVRTKIKQYLKEKMYHVL
ncbi:MAG: LytTR family DNA-binding domain-containing protein [Lachnospiraceae bacterium]|nr:LytTR family DNA-binding domain-containing protein [Lachnospiraceae bacterium]